MPIPLRLTVFQNDQLLGEHRFERDIVKIGRLASAHLKLEDTQVSRIHAVIEAGSDGQDYAVIDMGSKVGTFVNGRKISKERLSDGDTMTLGDYRIEVGYGDAGGVHPVPMSTGDVVGVAPDYAAGYPAFADPGSTQTGTYPVPQPSGVYPAPQTGTMPPMQPYGMPGQSGVYPMPGYAAQSGVYPAPGQSGVYPAMPPGGYPPPGMYPAPGQSGVYPQPGYPMPGYPAQSGVYPAPAQSGVYPAPGQSGVYPMPAMPQSGVYPAMAPTPDLRGTGDYPPVGDPRSTGEMPPVPMPTADLPPAAGPMTGSGDVAPGAWNAVPPQGAQMGGYHAGWVPPPSVPNNLASADVPDDERALELKLIWGSSVLDTVTATDQAKLTLGDERKVSGFGPFQKLVRCDLELPSNHLPSATHVFATRQGSQGSTYVLDIPKGMVGRVERADGMVIPVELLFAGEHGGQPDGAGGARYLLRPEETLYLGYRDMVLQVRYVRRTQLAPLPFWQRVNYVWANTLLLALFFHVVAISSFIATPKMSTTLTDELLANRNRFIETRLKLAEKKNSGGGLLDELKKGPGEKAKGTEGKAGKKDSKGQGKMAAKGKTDDKDRQRRALDKLLGLGGKGKAAGIFGGSGLGGDLTSAMGGLRGRQVGDARGLGGLGTRGTGSGGGGLSMSSVGLGTLGTHGRGGGGDGAGTGYGAGAASLGGKKERDIEISGGNARIQGSLSKEIIRRVIEKHRAQIRYCYEKELQRSPGLYGKVGTFFVIEASGAVQTAEVRQSTMGNDEVGRCITSKIRTWRFPKPKGGGVVEVTYPFLFKASG